MKVKKVAAIHDLSGVGRCSLTAAIPILSVLGVQPCPYPTAILSCQTGYDDFTFLDMTSEMSKIKDSFKVNNIKFEGIYSGFLGSIEQVEIVCDFIKENNQAMVFVDPVMGDHGEIYKTYSTEMCDEIKKLVTLANVVTPNLTEACILTGENYCDFKFEEQSLKNLAEEISKLGPNKVIITGIGYENYVYNYAYDSDTKKGYLAKAVYDGNHYSGTGDVFASILCGLLLKDKSLEYAVNKATDFISEAIKITSKDGEDPKNGIAIEGMLGKLL